MNFRSPSFHPYSKGEGSLASWVGASTFEQLGGLQPKGGASEGVDDGVGGRVEECEEDDDGLHGARHEAVKGAHKGDDDGRHPAHTEDADDDEQSQDGAHFHRLGRAAGGRMVNVMLVCQIVAVCNIYSSKAYNVWAYNATIKFKT